MDNIEKMMSNYDVEKWNERTMNIAENVSYYVYKHYLDGELFYIGKGRGLRCFEFKKRGAAWTNFVDGRESEIIVDIVKVFESENEAFNFESNEIVQCKSAFLVNVMHNKPKSNMGSQRLKLPRRVRKPKKVTRKEVFKNPTYIIYGSEVNDYILSKKLSAAEMKTLMSLVSQLDNSSLKGENLNVTLSFRNMRSIIYSPGLDSVHFKKRLKKFEDLGLMTYKVEKRVVEASFSKEFTDKILSNAKRYTVLNLKEYMNIISIYTLKMYMKLSENRMKGEFVIDKNDLLNFISPPKSYCEYETLRRTILPPLEENSEFFPNLAFSNILGNFLPDVCKFNFFKRRSTKMEKELAKADSNNVLELIEKYRY